MLSYNTALIPTSSLCSSLHFAIETAAPAWAELICPAPAAGLFMNKTFIRGLLDHRGHGSLLPLGDNWPIHIGQDGSERRELRGEEENLRPHTHTWQSLGIVFSDDTCSRSSESPLKWSGYKRDQTKTRRRFLTELKVSHTREARNS